MCCSDTGISYAVKILLVKFTSCHLLTVTVGEVAPTQPLAAVYHQDLKVLNMDRQQLAKLFRYWPQLHLVTVQCSSQFKWQKRHMTQ
jgi:hypothetical protein